MAIERIVTDLGDVVRFMPSSDSLATLLGISYLNRHINIKISTGRVVMYEVVLTLVGPTGYLCLASNLCLPLLTSDL